MRQWKPRSIDTIAEHKLLSVQRHHLESGDRRREALVFESADWVNVVPLLDDGRVVLVRQWRFGIGGFSLEVPGGLVEPGEDPAATAARELEEETGYRAERVERLGQVDTNPALFTNRMTFWLATGLERITAEPEGDGEEELEAVIVPLDEVTGMILDGRISHSLAVCSFFFLEHARSSGTAL